MSKPYGVRNLGSAHSAADEDSTELNPAEKALATAKHWVAEHPTTAVAACVALGLLVGYLVKRR